jgi:hypothetical protein
MPAERSRRRKQPESEVPIAPVNGNESAVPDEAQFRRFFVVALFFIVFGMWMLRSDSALT